MTSDVEESGDHLGAWPRLVLRLTSENGIPEGVSNAVSSLSAKNVQLWGWNVCSNKGWFTCKVYCFVEVDFLLGKVVSRQKPTKNSDCCLEQVDVLDDDRDIIMMIMMKIMMILSKSITMMITLLMSKLRLSFTQPCASLNSSFRFITWSQAWS